MFLFKEEEKSKRWQHVRKHQCQKKNIFKWYNMLPTIKFFSLIIKNLNDSIVWISIIMILAHEFNFRVLSNLWSLRIWLFWVLANLRPLWVQICGYSRTEILANLNLWVFANSKFSWIQNCKVWFWYRSTFKLLLSSCFLRKKKTCTALCCFLPEPFTCSVCLFSLF